MYHPLKTSYEGSVLEANSSDSRTRSAHVRVLKPIPFQPTFSFTDNVAPSTFSTPKPFHTEKALLQLLNRIGVNALLPILWMLMATITVADADVTHKTSQCFSRFLLVLVSLEKFLILSPAPPHFEIITVAPASTTNFTTFAFPSAYYNFASSVTHSLTLVPLPQPDVKLEPPSVHLPPLMTKLST